MKQFTKITNTLTTQYVYSTKTHVYYYIHLSATFVEYIKNSMPYVNKKYVHLTIALQL